MIMQELTPASSPSFFVIYEWPIIGCLVVAWIVYIIWSLRKMGVFGGFKGLKGMQHGYPLIGGRPSSEQKHAEDQAEVARLKRENERLTKAHADDLRRSMTRDIQDQAATKLETIVPNKLLSVDPSFDLTGRPLYNIGGSPVYDKTQILEALLDKTWFGRHVRSLMMWWYDWRCFGGSYDTLFYYTEKLLPSGKWAIIGTTKPAHRKRGDRWIKFPSGAKAYVIEDAQQSTVDAMIVNKVEVAQLKASVILSATCIGPLDAEELFKHKKAIEETGNV